MPPVTVNPARLSAPTLVAVGRAIVTARDSLVENWLLWIGERQGRSVLDEPELRRTLTLIVRLLTHMTGPLRREARETWSAATELFGRLAEARGLSAGEVADELQHLRELLIVELGDLIMALPVRQQLPAVLRVNRVCDMGVSCAVIGYTDALVDKMFSRDGAVPTTESTGQLVSRLSLLESELARFDARIQS